MDQVTHYSHNETHTCTQ